MGEGKDQMEDGRPLALLTRKMGDGKTLRPQRQTGEGRDGEHRRRMEEGRPLALLAREMGETAKTDGRWNMTRVIPLRLIA
jgi:hypothetical protein